MFIQFIFFIFFNFIKTEPHVLFTGNADVFKESTGGFNLDPESPYIVFGKTDAKVYTEMITYKKRIL